MYQGGHRRGIDHRIGVGRTTQGGNAAARRSRGLAGAGGLVFMTGFAQVGAEVHPPGADHVAASVDFPIGTKYRGRIAERDDTAVGDPEVAHAVGVVGRIDHAAVADDDAHQATLPSASGTVPKHMAITAMRTAIPWVTCCKITECGPPATLETISTPRLIGPGCITMTSGLAAASVSSVRP